MRSDARSLRRRGVLNIVGRHSDPNASATARRDLRDVLERILDAIPDEVGIEALPAALRNVMSPSKPPTDEQRSQANRYAEGIRCSLAGLAHFDVLLRQDDEVANFWDWGRRTLVALEDLARASDPSTRSLLDEAEMQSVGAFTNRACPSLLSVLGCGIRILEGRRSNAAIAQPPVLHGVGRANTS
jgi:hypothetical protein